MQRILNMAFASLLALAMIGSPVHARIDQGLATPPADLERGQTLAAQGDVQGALEAYQKVVQARPDWHEAHAFLGGMQLMNQRYRDAVLSFQKAISLGAESRRPFIGMGMAYIHMGQFGPARAAFTEAKARSGDAGGDIDAILVWLDTKESGSAGAHP